MEQGGEREEGDRGGGGTRTDRRKTSQRGRFWTAGNSEREEEVAGMKTEKVKRCSFFFLPPKKDPLSGSVLHFCSDFLFQWVTLHLMGFSLLQDLCVCPSYTPPNAFQCILKSKWQWKEKNRVGGACRHFRHVHDRGGGRRLRFFCSYVTHAVCARVSPYSANTSDEMLRLRKISLYFPLPSSVAMATAAAAARLLARDSTGQRDPSAR